MFFSYHILVRKNSNFALIWRYMHDKKKANRNELLELNISNVCNDLRKYIPTGSLNLYELQNKMSLYLLGQLLHGITLVFEFQANTLCQFANETAKSLLRISKEEKQLKRKRKKMIFDEEEEIAYNSDVLDQPKQKQISKKICVRSMLDLNDPSSYVTEKPIRNISMFEPMFDAEDMFQVPEMLLPHLEPTEDFVKIQKEVAEADRRSQLIEKHQKDNELQIDVSLKDPKVSIGNFNFTIESMEEMRARGTSNLSAPEIFKHSEIFDNISQVKTEKLTPVIFNQQKKSIAQEKNLSQELQEEFYLNPLQNYDLKNELLEPKRKKKKYLVIDKEKILTHDTLVDQMKNFSDLIKPINEIFIHPLEFQKISVNKLFHPRPWHIDYLNENLLLLFDVALKKYSLQPLTFEQAIHYDLDRIRQRQWEQLNFEIQSWNSELFDETLNKEKQNFIKSFELYNNLLDDNYQVQKENINGQFEIEEKNDVDNLMQSKISVGDWQNITNEEQISDSDIEAKRFESLDARHSIHNRSDKKEFLRNESYFEDDFDINQISDTIAVQTAKELSQKTFISDDMNFLYKSIINTYGTDVCKFSNLFEKNTTKQLVAKNFATLLCLLKQGEIKVKQTIPYGEIFVRVIIPKN